MAITRAEAYELIREHHRVLGEQLRARVTAVSAAAVAGRPHEGAVAELVAYIAGEIVPHAAAEEETVYQAAAGLAGLAGTISQMTAVHHRFLEAIGRLAGAADAAAAVAPAQEIARLFARQVAKENEVLLPALLADPSIDLATLLAEMSDRIERSGTAGSYPASDPLAAVLSLLLDATTLLARVGQPEPARRLAASARAVLREPRPELAERVTAILPGLIAHDLGRRVSYGQEG